MVLAGGVAAVLFVSTASASAAAVIPGVTDGGGTHGGGRPHAQKVWQPRPVEKLPSTAPVSAVRAHTGGKAAVGVSAKPVAPVWPGAAQYDVPLTGPGDFAAGVEAGSGGTRPPVYAAAAPAATAHTAAATTHTAAANGKAPSAAAPSRVHVVVAGHGAAVAAGVSGIVFTVTRADGSPAAGAAQVSVDYGAWAQAYGGGFADRLSLVELPACALTTPSLAACREQTPVTSTHDRAGQKLTATVDLPAATAPRATTATAASAASAAPRALVLAATASATGVDGSYAATPLKSSDSWTAGGSSGSFTWSYPMNSPGSLGAAPPKAELAYNSASVDGRTTVSNGQPSVVGEGFDLGGASSFIETNYEPCARVNPTAWSASGDLCQGVANATISGGSHAGGLVRDDATGTWRLAADDGTRIQLVTGTTGGSNNTANQAYWKLTATDGTVYLYGANRLPAGYGGTGADSPTYSTWSEPVFGTGSGTSCNDPTGTEDPQTCLQGWRWNLDFVIDPHSNVTRYSYARELDNYEHKSATTAYTRSGFLREIDYGWQTGDVAKSTGLISDGTQGGSLPAATMQFGYAPRCVPSASGCPAASVTVSSGVANTGITAADALAFPDVPYDRHCAAGSSSCTNYSPSYWSTVRLTSMRTAVNNGGAIANQPAGTPAGYEAVDAYALNQSFPAPEDNATTGNRPQLRLDSVVHTGYLTNADGSVATTAAPAVNFGYSGTLPNRVVASWNPLSSTAQFYRFRLTDITDELGSETVVSYGQPNGLACATAGSAPPKTIANATLCYPEYFDNNGTMVADWYNKYVVMGVTVYDDTLKGTGYVYSAPHATNYTYLGAPAWHTNDSELADPKYRTVDQFRGFRQVETDTSGEVAGSNAKTVVTYFQGMDEDPTAYVCLNDSHDQAPVSTACPAGGYRDDNALAGKVLETQTYLSETSNTVVEDVIDAPQDPTDLDMVTATHTRASGLPVQRAHFSHIQKAITYDQVSTSSTPRRSEIDYSYDNSLSSFTGGGSEGGNGRLMLTDDKGDTDASGHQLGDVPELCTFTGYAGNIALGADGAQWSAYPYTTVTSTVPAGQSCTTSSETAATVTAQTLQLFDGLPTGQVSKGDVTTKESATAFNAWVVTGQAGYDRYGRVTSTTNADGGATQTTYLPATPPGLLPLQVQTKNPMGWTATQTLERGRAVPLASADVNGRESDAVYDGLGRVLSAWKPDHPKSTNATSPNVIYSYGDFGVTPGSSGPAANPYVETQTLREDGSYAVAYSILDGFGDQIETQSTPVDGSSGLVSTQTEYNSLGKPFRTAAAHWDSANSPSGTFRNYGDALPSQTYTTYDGLSRPLTVGTYHNAVLIPGMVTTTAYPGADRTDVTGPAGNGAGAAWAKSTFTDVRGRKTADWTYHNAPPTPTGNPADADIVSYGLAYVPGGSTATVTDGTTKNVWTTKETDLLGYHETKLDPDTGTSTEVKDGDGLVLQLTDGRGKTTSYYYDALGRKTAAYDAPWVAAPSTPAASALIDSWAYDSAPSSDGKTDDGLPASSTSYTDSGTQGYVSAVTGYDAGGRPLGTKVTIPNADGNGNLAGSYESDNTYTSEIGLLDHTDLPAIGSVPAETVYNSYNVNGLLLATGGNADYVSATQYDQLGRILSRTLGDYPYQVVQQTIYDAATGRVTNVFTDATSGRNVNNTSQLNTYSADDVSYAYDAAGQLTSAADLQNWTVSGSYDPGPQQRDNQCFTYDYAGRVTNAWADKGDQTPSATTNLNAPTTAMGGLGSCADSTADNAPGSAAALGGPAPYWQTYTFDATGAAGLGDGALTGNRSTIVDHDPSGDTAKDVTRTSSYPAAGTLNAAGSSTSAGTGPNLLSSVTASGGASGTDNYSYDGSGDLTGRSVTTQGASGNANETLTWNDEGQLATDTNTTTKTTAGFVYDADGNTLMRRDYTAGTQSGTVTLYLGGAQLSTSTGSGAVTGTRHYAYPSAPRIVADNTGGLTYEIGNQQDTAGTTLNAANGTVTARRYFTPYGGARGAAPSAWPDDHTFLNKPTDAATGLTTVGARSYDAQTGRFVSADSVFEIGDENQMGGYSYAGDDPVSASDPTGQSSGPSLTRLCEMDGGTWDNGTCDVDSAPSSSSSSSGSSSDTSSSSSSSSSGSGGQHVFGPYVNSGGTSKAFTRAYDEAKKAQPKPMIDQLLSYSACGNDTDFWETMCTTQNEGATAGSLLQGPLATAGDGADEHFLNVMAQYKADQAGLNKSAQAYKDAQAGIDNLKNGSSNKLLMTLRDGSDGLHTLGNGLTGLGTADAIWSEYDTARDSHSSVGDSVAKAAASGAVTTGTTLMTVTQFTGGGAAIGEMIDPLGGAIPGAAIGAVAGAIASIPVSNMVNNVINWFD